MKPIYLYSTPSGPINLIKAEDMPVKPIKPPDEIPTYAGTLCIGGDVFGYEKALKKYEAALKAAKESSVPIQDQQMAAKLISDNANIANIYSSLIFSPGTIHGPFTVEYQIDFKCKSFGRVLERECKCCLEDCGQVAILLPDKEPQEDQETLWREVDRIFNVKWTFGMPDDVMQELKEKFIITRKQ